MRNLFATVVVALVVVGSAAPAGASGQSVRVNTTLGVVEGFYNDAGGVSFLGVPYGDSVSGAFRWTVPRPAPNNRIQMMETTKK